MSWRIDYAADGHGLWLSKTDEVYDDVWAAIKRAQQRLARWEPCIGFRIVPAAMPAFEKMTFEHLGKMIGLDGRKMIP